LWTSATVQSSSVIYQSAGNIGIGTTTPTTKLDVVGSGNTQLSIGGTTAGAYTQLYLSGSGRQYGIGVGNASETTYGVANEFFLFDHNAGAMRMVVDTSGNVGIGTTNPAAFGLFTVSGGGIGIHLNSTSGAAGINFYEGGTGRFSLRTLNGSNGFSFYDSNAGTERVRIDSSGNVGIGTTSPAYPLQVRRAGGGGSLGVTIDNVGSITRASQYFAIGDTTSVTTGHAFYARNSTATDNLMVTIDGTGVTVGGNLAVDTNTLYVDAANDRVGIGTTSPGASLHVEKASSDNIIAAIGQTGYEGVLYLSGAGSGKDTSIVIGNGKNLNFKATATATPTASGTTVMTLGANSYLTLNGAANDGRIQFSNTARATASGLWVGVDSTQSYVLSRGSYPLTFYTDATERMRINSSGNVGIGTTSPGALLHVQGAYSGSTATFTGNVTALSLTETSTITLKDNVRALEDISVTELEPVRFTWKDSQKEDIGLIAEQVAPLFPELVEFDDKGNPIGVHYSRLTVLLLKSIKSLTNEIEELKHKL